MSLFLQEQFDQYIKEKHFLSNLAFHTIRSYKLAFQWFQKLDGEINKTALQNFVIGMRESGMNIGGCNVKIRSINSFLSWLYENGHNPENLRIKKLRGELFVIKTFTDAHIKAFINFKPKDKYQWRIYTTIALLIDTGCRIDEILSLTTKKVDMEQLLITIRGKGNKERFVPISLEMRKILFLYMNRQRFKVGDLMFPTKSGTKMIYQNFLRDFKLHCTDLGITDARTSPHGLRHYFAQNYLRMGGDLYRLSRILGHTNIATTQIYLRSMGIESIREAHQQFSPLSRGR